MKQEFTALKIHRLIGKFEDSIHRICLEYGNEFALRFLTDCVNTAENIELDSDNYECI